MNDVEHAEREMAGMRGLIEQRDMALRLAEVPEFRTLFLEGFCKDHAARLVCLSTDPNLSAEIRASSLAEAQAAGFVKRYLSQIMTVGNNMERSMPEYEQALDDLRANSNQ